MIAILASLGLLIGGAALCACLVRRPRVALAAATLSIAAASLLSLGAALDCLTHGDVAAPAALEWPMPLGEARLALDGLSAWFLATIALLGVAVSVYAWGYMQAEVGRGPVAALGALLCLLIAALIVVVTSADAVLFLVAWEVMMLSSFLLVSFHHHEPQVRRAAWIYLVANHIGTALFVVPLFAILAAKAGTTDLRAFPAALQSVGSGTCVTLFVLGLLGFGTKAGFMPMHIWLPAAHPVAPSPVSALLSGVVIKVGIYGLLRLLGWLPNLPVGCAIIMLAFGMTSGVLGVLYALAQHDIKRLLAYHSVENIGIIGLGIGIGMLGQTLGKPALVALGYGGALLHVLNHALFKGLLFLSAGAVLRSTGVGEIERLGGLARKTPVNAALFLVAAIAICGLPPLNGFVSEWLVYAALFSGTQSASRAPAAFAALGAMALALMGGLALACFAKVFGVVFLGRPRDPSLSAAPTPTTMRLGMFLPAALCVGIGLFPALVLAPTLRAAATVAGLPAEALTAAMHSALGSAGELSLVAALLLGCVALLALVRRGALQSNMRQPAAAVATWGCGYSSPVPRMQYTASSFAWPLIASFRQLLWPERPAAAPAGTFAGHAELETHTPDMAEHDFFAPLLRGVDRLLRMVRTLSWSGEVAPPSPAPGVRSGAAARIGPLSALVSGAAAALRRGSVHVYLAYLVLTLLAVFAVEALTLPGPLDGVSK